MYLQFYILVMLLVEVADDHSTQTSFVWLDRLASQGEDLFCITLNTMLYDFLCLEKIHSNFKYFLSLR